MIKGTIVFIKANEESKSAGTYPYLALENGEKVKIVLQNSNPFENNELSAYENKAVLVEGEYNEYGTLVATSISCKNGEEIAPAAIPEMDLPPLDASFDIALGESKPLKKEEDKYDALTKTLCEIVEKEAKEKEELASKKPEPKKLTLAQRFKLLFARKKK